MTHPKNLQSQLFTYTLPEEKIAQFPLSERDQSRLLIYQNHLITEDIYAAISNYLPAGSLLVFNNTSVIHARLIFQKTSGGLIEIFLLEPADEDGYAGLAVRNKGVTKWKCLIGGASKWKYGNTVQKKVFMQDIETMLTARIVERPDDSFLIEFSWNEAGFSFLELLDKAGSMPIPPYLKRNASEFDDQRYQTIYANKMGSVAAPTAGLHFTEHIFSTLHRKRIEPAYITLHVGAGTFIPVKSDTLEGHAMHAEEVQVETAFLEKLINAANQVFAVGTTSLRTIESLYWMGLKCKLNPAIPATELCIKQWDPYDMEEDTPIPAERALTFLLQWMKNNELDKLIVKTQLLIVPPYQPRIANGLITNFHQPGSTLLMLVAAVTNNRWKELYDYALQHDFRFLSYGDGCLLFFD